jgi:ABC-type glutathione transport system ATPase component
LFALDEPTSGLDATTALDLMKLLKRLACNGMSIICALHQPRAEIFALVDDLLLLQAGRQIYFGEAAQALHFLAGSGIDSYKKVNPADAIMDALAQGRHRYTPPTQIFQLTKGFTSPKEVNASYEEPEESVAALLLSIRRRQVQWHQPVMLVFMRGITQQGRQTGSLSLEIISGAFTGMFIGLSNYEFRGHLFQGLFYSPFEALSSAVSYRLLAEQSVLSCIAIVRSLQCHITSLWRYERS